MSAIFKANIRRQRHRATTCFGSPNFYLSNMNQIFFKASVYFTFNEQIYLKRMFLMLSLNSLIHLSIFFSSCFSHQYESYLSTTQIYRGGDIDAKQMHNIAPSIYQSNFDT